MSDRANGRARTIVAYPGPFVDGTKWFTCCHRQAYLDGTQNIVQGLRQGLHRLRTAALEESQQNSEGICAIQALVVENDQGHQAKKEGTEQEQWRERKELTPAEENE